jgi:hypothetical protein
LFFVILNSAELKTRATHRFLARDAARHQRIRTLFQMHANFIREVAFHVGAVP